MASKKALVKAPAPPPAAVPADGLNDLQRRFCEEYLIDLNGTQAAIRAGYAKKSASAEAARQLGKVNIRAYIGKLMDERSTRTLVTADFVVDSLVEVAHRSMQAVPVLVFSPEEGGMVHKGAADGKPVYEFDSTGANKALELLGKHLGIFLDKKEKNVQKTLIVRYADDANPPASA